MRRLGLALALILAAGPLAAVEPDEILADPALEARAREISTVLRCTVCQNESIDASHAPVARDIRLLVRELLVEGKTDDEVMAAIVDRFGEFVLLRPDWSGINLVLWLSGPALLIAALGIGLAATRRRPEAEALSEAEAARLDEILRRDA